MIKSISLRNFMSYVSADIPLSQGVNFICGPNGSGKSTILIAISLALGLSRTERGKKLSDLIRWGAEKSTIRLILDNRIRNGTRPFPDYDTDDLEIQRSLTKSGSYPIKIDGVPSTKEELTDLIRHQGVNPDNMLIIMQQDMVEEFSLLSPVEKLAMLEEVIEFQSYRRDLLQARDDLEALLGEEKQARQILDGSSRRVTEWERLYGKYQRKRKLEDDLEDLTAEALWAKVAEGERILEQLESRMGEREQELEHVGRRLEDLNRKIQERSGHVEDSWANLESGKNALLQAARRHEASRSKAEMVNARLDDERSEIERLRSSISKNKAEIETALRKIGKLRKEGDMDGDEEVLDSRLSKMRIELANIVPGKKIVELESKIAAKRVRIEELERMISLTRERISYPYGSEIMSVGEEAASIPSLTGMVYGPLYTCLESDDFSFDIIRSLVGDDLMRSFVTTTEPDKAKVAKLLKERGIDSTVYLVPDSALVLIEEKYLPEEEGVLDWAINRIKMSRHVRALLQRVAGSVLLVSPGEQVERLAELLGTPVVNKRGEGAGLLQGLIPRVKGCVPEERKRLEGKLEVLIETYSKIQKEISQLSEDLEVTRKEQEQSLQSMLDQMLSLFSRLELMRADRVPTNVVLQREADRVRAAAGALVEFKEKRLTEKSRGVQQLRRELDSVEKSQARFEEEVSKTEIGYQRARERLERQLKVYYEIESKRLLLTDQVRSAKAAVRDLEYRTSKRRDEVQRLARDAEELSPRIPSPRDLLELEREISSIRGSLNELSDVPDDIEGVYKTYLSEFENLKKSLKSIIEKRGEMQAELRKGLGRWRGIMNRHLDEINRDLNHILEEIGGSGRVELVNGDVRKVGLDITVAFEGKEMTSISTLTQSGGEKSLSTMAYLLALQHQIKSPFRAVDEYDVHLDPVNRDRITHLIKSAVRGDSKQYIAITPSQISKQDLEEVENVIVVQSVEGRSRVGSLVLEAS